MEAFHEAFEHGDELFEIRFDLGDGVGANVGPGIRFSRVPRADLDEAGQWARHVPARSTGPNAQACNSCHSTPFDDGAGKVVDNVVRDPFHTGSVDAFISRNTPHLFGIGAVQRLAEEMTIDLHAQRDRLVASACDSGESGLVALSSKGVDFGSLGIDVLEGGASCRFELESSDVSGVDEDLVVRPLHWKGRDSSIRQFNLDAAHNELGMQSVELVGEDVDGDGDGVVNELSIGDQTALAIYLAAQPRPVTRRELAREGLIPALERAELETIGRGETHFADAGCAGCHMPSLHLDDPVFREPSALSEFRRPRGPEVEPKVAGPDPAHAVTFDLTRDLPDNEITLEDGRTRRIGNFETDAEGRAVVRLYSDMKRHDMGPALADSIDEIDTGASVWLTKSLWGVGSTAPYLHDGRATTLSDAILAHGGEAESSRDAFARLDPDEQAALVAFLEDMVLFKIEEEEDGEEVAIAP